MHVRDIEVFLLHDTYVLVRVVTTDGVVGWGSTGYHRGGQTGGAEVLAGVAAGLGASLIGEEVANTAEVWHRAVRTGYRLGHTGAQMSALSAFDIAFHDCKGRALGAPVWNLLGGRWRERVRSTAAS